MTVAPLEVLLVRDVPEEQMWSMDRYADALEASLARRSDVAPRAFALHEPRWARGRAARRAVGYALRFGGYPIAVSRERADVVHIVDHGYAHAAAFAPRHRTVVTCHDLMLLLGDDVVGGALGRASRVRFRWTVSYLRRVGHVACVSDATAADVERICRVPPARITVVPNGIGEAFRELPAPERDAARRGVLRGHAHAILHVSSAVPYKNVPATLRVLARLCDEGHDVALVRVGDALTADEAALASVLGVAERVLECGRVAEHRLVELYNGVDVLLFPSYREGFGWPPLEAMACGTPVVCSDRPAHAEIVADAALRADPDDVPGLAAAVAAVIGDAAVRDRLRAAGRALASRYTWDRTAAAFAAIYHSLANRPATPLGDGAARG